MSNMIEMKTIDELIALCEEMGGEFDKQCLELRDALWDFDTDPFIESAIQHPKLLKYLKTIRDCNKYFGAVSALTEVLEKLRDIKMKEVEKRKGKCESCKHSRWWGEYAMTICEKYGNTSMLEVCVDYEEKAKDINVPANKKGGRKMNFEKALTLLKQGKKLRRRKWRKDEYVEKQGRCIARVQIDSNSKACYPYYIELYDNDLLARDWEVCDE